ncbi:hypothetical protein AAG570_002750, partial [Ranatra chinensis]
EQKGLVLGAYEGCEPGELILTPAAQKFDCQVNGKLTDLIKGSRLKAGKALCFGNLSEDYYEVAVAGLGPEGQGFDSLEHMDMCREDIRAAAGAGARALQERGCQVVHVEGFTNAEAAAEGATLGVWKYQELKDPPDRLIIPKLELYDSEDADGWMHGTLKADNQNVARRLEESPANIMTPAIFAQNCIELLCPCGVQVDVKGLEWLETQKMIAFLSIAKGSCEPPLFVELSYCGGDMDEKPVGITYDSGGIDLKPDNAQLIECRGDMCGAAVVVAVIRAAAQMRLPINLRGLLPLCENMIGGLSVKPGDVVVGMNGKSIRLEHTDNEGRVILADALTYSSVHKPCLIINVADFQTGIKDSMGTTCTGVFSTSPEIWEELRSAGAITGDRVWRFPLWKFYANGVTDFPEVDVNNVGKAKGGDPCYAAAFLMEFVPPVDFVHMDISGTGMLSAGIEFPYLRRGTMSGRPTRTLIQFLYQLACPHQPPQCAPPC